MNIRIKISILLVVSFNALYCFSQNEKYNRYKYAREEYMATGEEMFAETAVNCESAEKYIQQCFDQYKSDTSEISKRTTLMMAAKMNCAKAVEVFEYVIASDSSEIVRCEAIQYLGWIRAEQSTPFLLQHATKNISDYEKACIGSALSVIGKRREATAVLKSVCYTSDSRMCDKCVWSYYIIGGDEAIDYFYYMFSFPQYKLGAALKLAELGEYEKPYPVFLEALDSGEQKKVITALFGLASIGDEKAIELIQQHASAKDPMIARDAKFILEWMTKEIGGENEKK